jgi:hypothetical protein
VFMKEWLNWVSGVTSSKDGYPNLVCSDKNQQKLWGLK